MIKNIVGKNKNYYNEFSNYNNFYFVDNFECTNNTDCGGFNAGTCVNIINGIGICTCPSHLANPNCTYVRIYLET